MTKLCGAIAAGLGLLLAGTAWADVVYLYGGKKIEGKVTSPPNAQVVVIETPMGRLQYRSTMVEKIVPGDEADQPADQPTTDKPIDNPTQPTGPANPTSQSDDDAAIGPADPAIRAKFAETVKLVEQVKTGAEGLALWQQFMKDCPAGGPIANLANTRMAVWKERADKDLVRFGPEWLPRTDVDKRTARAEELFGQAASADTDEAVKLLIEAAKENPYRADIPMRKAAVFQKAGKTREFCGALAEVIKLDPTNVVANNNLAVKLAEGKQWAQALRNLSMAAATCENDTLLDNMDAVIAMAEADGAFPKVLDSYDSYVRRVVDQLHRDGKHTGEARWGNTWISQEEYAQNVKANADADKQISAYQKKMDDRQDRRRTMLKKMKANENELKRIENLDIKNGRIRFRTSEGKLLNNDFELYSRKTDLTEENTKISSEILKVKQDIDGLQQQITNAQAQKVKPPHARRMVVLDIDGQSEAGTVNVPDAPADKGDDSGDLFD